MNTMAIIIVICLLWVVIKAIMQDNEDVDRQTEVTSCPLSILKLELLNPDTSLGWKYKQIYAFCYDYPSIVSQLKESEHYKRWRTDVIDWAKNNIERLEGFYFCDGIVDFIYDASQHYTDLIDLRKRFNMPQDTQSDVICEVEFNNKRVPRDYFEFPALVWEDEKDDDDFDNYGNDDKKSNFSDALGVGMGIGIVNGLTGGSVLGGGSGGN